MIGVWLVLESASRRVALALPEKVSTLLATLVTLVAKEGAGLLVSVLEGAAGVLVVSILEETSSSLILSLLTCLPLTKEITASIRIARLEETATASGIASLLIGVGLTLTLSLILEEASSTCLVAIAEKVSGVRVSLSLILVSVREETTTGIVSVGIITSPLVALVLLRVLVLALEEIAAG